MTNKEIRRMQNNEVKDKTIPKRPISIEAYTYGKQIPGCPTCAGRISIGQRECLNCGQKIIF